MSKRILLLCVLAAVLFGGTCGDDSCVQFDGQSVVARRDAEHDRLDLLLIYRDLHTTGDPAKGIEQLETIRSGARWFAFVRNFPLLLNLDELAKRDRNADQPAESALLDALAAHTTVRSGPLWMDGEGRLCGSQLVRLDDLRATLAAINVAIREALKLDANPKDSEDLYLNDAESLRLLREAVAAGHDFVGLRGSAPYLALPVSDAGFVAMKRAWLEEAWTGLCEDCAKSPKEQVHLRAALEALAVNEWTIERSPGLVTFILGNPLAPAIELTAPPTGLALPGTAGVLARRALADALKPRGWTIADSDGEAAARASFEAFTHEP